MPTGPTNRTQTWILAVVFGLSAVPWTYGFVAGLDLPLWPSFVAAATYYAAGGGLDGLSRGAVGNVTGVAYAAATIAVVDGPLGGGTVALSIVVGGFMLLASLHTLVPPLSFAPAAFLGYATLFGVHSAGTPVVLSGLLGETLAAAAAMLVGAGLGYATDAVSMRLATASSTVGAETA